MDHITSVGYRLSQHQAADLARDAERRRLITERRERAGGRSAPSTRRSWLPTARRIRSPRFVLPVLGIAVMGSFLGLSALPQDVERAHSAPAMELPVMAPGAGLYMAR